MSNEANFEYSWDPEKRKLVISERGLDFVEYAPLILANENVVVELDDRKKYGEERFRAYAYFV